MNDISYEQIVLQYNFLKKLDLFCIFKFIISNKIRIYNEEAYDILAGILTSYQTFNLNGKYVFSENEKLYQHFFENREKERKKKDAKDKIEKNQGDKMYLNDSIISKNMPNHTLFQLFKFPEDDVVLQYIQNICNNGLIDEPLNINLSFKKLGTNANIDSSGSLGNLNDEIDGKGIQSSGCINSVSTSNATKFETKLDSSMWFEESKTLSVSSTDQKESKEERDTNDHLINLDKSKKNISLSVQISDLPLNLKQCITDSREVNCCLAKINLENSNEKGVDCMQHVSSGSANSLSQTKPMHHTTEDVELVDEDHVKKSFQCRTKSSSNELSVYDFSLFNINYRLNNFYDDTALCLSHFHHIHNFLNRDPTGLRKIKIMIKNEIATISISPFYINFDGSRVFENICSSFHLNKDDYKKKKLYYILKLCLNNENALSRLRNIFLDNLREQEHIYDNNVCITKKVESVENTSKSYDRKHVKGKKKKYKKKHFRNNSIIKKRLKSEEQISEILDEQKRINVLYFINRFLYSQKTPLSYLFGSNEIEQNETNEIINHTNNREEETNFDELTIDYYLLMMLLENKVEQSFLKFLIEKLKQCREESTKEIQEASQSKITHDENKTQKKEKNEPEKEEPNGIEGNGYKNTKKTCENKNMEDELLLLKSIRPFPTIFWLINKNLCAYLSHLEKMNIIKKIEKIIQNTSKEFAFLRTFLIYDHLKYTLVRMRHINKNILLFFYSNFVNSESFIHMAKIPQDVINRKDVSLEINKNNILEEAYRSTVETKLMSSIYYEKYEISSDTFLRILRKINTLRINGIGGISNFLTLKCIHLYFASHLSYQNTIGHILEECFKT